MERRLDLPDAVLVAVGTVVGGGIFLAPGLAAETAGPALLVSLAIAAAAALVSGLAAAAIAGAPGQALPPARHLAGILRLAAQTVAAAALAGAFAAYALGATGPAGANTSRTIAASLVIGLAALGIAGVRITWRAGGALVAIKLSALAFLVGLSLPLSRSANFRPFSPEGFGGTWAAAALLFFVFGGFARLSEKPAEVMEAGRTIPRATVWAVLLALALYLAVCAASIGVAGALFTGHFLQGEVNNAPLLVVASLTTMPAVARAIVTIGALAATASSALALLIGASESAAALSRAGTLPPAFGRRLPGAGAPWLGLALASLLSAVLAAAGAAGVPALVAASAFLALLYGATLNALALARVPGAARLVYVLGLAACLALALALPRPAILWGLAAAASGLALYPMRSLWRD